MATTPTAGAGWSVPAARPYEPQKQASLIERLPIETVAIALIVMYCLFPFGYMVYLSLTNGAGWGNFTRRGAAQMQPAPQFADDPALAPLAND